ncbi:MAG: lysophospholipid acyltransferase family protein [Candidatus Hydrothermales bacterium]
MKKLYKRVKRVVISFSILSLVKFFYYYPIKFYKALALFFYFFLSKFRKIGLKNLEILNFKKKILWKNFCFMTYCALRFIKLRKKSEDEIVNNVEVSNLQILIDKMDKKRGVFVFTLHFGFWEIIPIYFSLKGLKVCVIASKVYTDSINNFINNIRKKFNIEVFHPENAYALIKRLKKGYAAGILMDQKQGGKRSFVNFFGKKVEAPIGPLEIAYKLKPEVLLMRTLNLKDKDHIYIENFNLSYNLNYDLQCIYNKFEEWIREKPWQWILIHQRF